MNSPASKTNIRFNTAESALIQHILPSMVLAPSAHNTQPWKFVVQGNTIDVLIDWQRHLTVSDPTHRQLFVSIGCALANAVVAGQYWGYQVELEYFPNGHQDDQPVARVVCSPHSSSIHTKDHDSLFSAIEKRRTNRELYDATVLTVAEKTALGNDPSSAEATAGKPAVQLIENKETIKTIADITEEGTVLTLSRQDFKQELSQWVRNNWTRQNDGMPGYAMGMPLPVSLLGSIMVRFAPIHKQEGPKSRQQINSASAIAVIATPTDTPEDWMKAGVALEQIWLRATMAEVAVAPIVSAIEASSELRQRLQTVCGTSLLPQSLVRLGHASTTTLRHTPRRSLEDCLK